MSYGKQKRVEINNAILFTIEEHLTVLNSEITLPIKKGRINDLRLLQTVTSRDTVYNNLVALLDNPEIDQRIKAKSENRILSGLKKTNEELITKIIMRPLKTNTEDTALLDDDSITSDDIISSTSNASKKAVDLMLLIKNRIEAIENPETVKQRLDSQLIPSIAERYAKNR